jgi:hypothetical protein
MTNGLMPDELGAAGESLFAGLCARAGLVCNKSDRDRTGWDFVVEFPMPQPGVGIPLDGRSPTACAVQLKSTATAGPIKVRLSAAERLAKDPRPAFIVVFRLTPGGEGITGFLIHLVDRALGKVLHRLRVAHANKAFDVNRATISFDHRKLGTQFVLTPHGLRQALLDAMSDDPAAYVAEKQRQLSELGYRGMGLEAEVLVRLENIAHLSDIALGLAPLKPERLRAYDTRFGIRLPYVGPVFDDIEEMRIDPPSVGRCVVAIRGAGLLPAAVFDAEMVAGLPIKAEGGTWLLVRHPDFNIKFGSESANFASTGEFHNTVRSLGGWISLMRGLNYLVSGDGVITLAPESTPGTRITLPMSSKLDGPYLDQLPDWLGFLLGWERLLNLAGIPPGEPFSIQDLWAARGAALAVELFGDRPSRAWFAFDRKDIGQPVNPVDAIYINTATMAGASVSYGVKITLEPNEASPGEYRSTRFHALDVRPAVPDLQDYGEDLADEHDLKIVINPANVTEIDPSAC